MRIPHLFIAAFILTAVLCFSRPCLAQANPVLCWGSNGNGQLGDGTNTNGLSPAAALGISGIKAISAGRQHTLALTSSGQVHAWGYNHDGQLGLGDTTDRTIPTLIPSLRLIGSPIIAIAAGGSHSLALAADGTIYAWGWNGHGQLGLGDYMTRYVPTAASLTGNKAIAAGDAHSLSLSLDGRMYSTGFNYVGQLGLGNNNDYNRWTVVTGMPPVKAIACGMHHSVALTHTGQVWCAGWNESGQLGTGTTTDSSVFAFSSAANVRAIAAGPHAEHTLAIRQDGTVAGWGLNRNGQLGDGSVTNQLLPVEMPGVHNAKAAAAGAAHSVLLLADGTAMAVGSNSSGQLGNGTSTSRLNVAPIPGSGQWSAISAGFDHTVALKCMDGAKAWGFGAYGQLGNGGTAIKNVPTAVTGFATGTLAVAQGGVHTLFLKADGTVWATGDNTYGQLGIGSATSQTRPVKVPSLSNVIAVAAGTVHSMALTADGWVWAWGDNSIGQLGLGDSLMRTAPVRVGWGAFAITCGEYDSAALVADGWVWTWGWGYFGQLGLGDTNYRLLPDRVAGSQGAIGIFAGSDHCMAIWGHGVVSRWGRNGSGQLALGDTADRPSPADNSPNYSRAVAAAGGGYHTLILNASGQVQSAGYNVYGQLGIGNQIDQTSWKPQQTQIVGIAAYVLHSAEFDAWGNLYTFGYNGYGQLGDGSYTHRNLPQFIQNHLFTTGLGQGPSANHTVALSNPPISIQQLSFSKTSVKGGDPTYGTCTATVYLTAKAGRGGLVVALSSNCAEAPVPETVTVPAGSKTATFSIVTASVSTVTKATITATLVYTKSKVLTINP